MEETLQVKTVSEPFHVTMKGNVGGVFVWIFRAKIMAFKPRTGCRKLALRLNNHYFVVKSRVKFST